MKGFVVLFNLILCLSSAVGHTEVLSDDEYLKDTAERVQTVKNSPPPSRAAISRQPNSISQEEYQLFLGYKQWRLEFIRDTFEAQYWVSWGIFGVVITLTGFALWIIYRQFEAGTPSKDQPPDAAELLQSALKISKEGMEIRTPFIGLVILIITFLFLMAYLENVHEISFVTPPTEEG